MCVISRYCSTQQSIPAAAATLRPMNVVGTLSMNASSYSDLNSNNLNNTPEKPLTVGALERPSMYPPLSEISLLDYVRRDTNTKPIPGARDSPANVSTTTAKKHKQRIKNAGRQSKIWLSHVKEKHKTTQWAKRSPLNQVDNININIATRVRRHHQLKPLDRSKLGYRSLPQSREFPHHHKDRRIEEVRRVTYTDIHGKDSLRNAEEFLQKRRSRRANQYLNATFEMPKPPLAPIRSHRINLIEETSSFYHKVAKELSRHKQNIYS